MMDAGGTDYDIDFTPGIEAFRSLAGIAVRRPDIAASIDQLARDGTLLNCRLERRKIGRPVVRYYPSGCFALQIAAVALPGMKK